MERSADTQYTEVSLAAVSSAYQHKYDHGLKRKITALHNEPSDNPALHYPREVWNRSHDQPWATQHNYNPYVPRPSHIDSSNGAWRPSINMEASQPVSVPIPQHHYKNHTRSAHDMLNATNTSSNDDVPFCVNIAPPPPSGGALFGLFSSLVARYVVPTGRVIAIVSITVPAGMYIVPAGYVVPTGRTN
ncbi:hypothetical protein Tco_0697145 [Tanacetum coccineum]